MGARRFGLYMHLQGDERRPARVANSWSSVAPGQPKVLRKHYGRNG